MPIRRTAVAGPLVTLAIIATAVAINVTAARAAQSHRLKLTLDNYTVASQGQAEKPGSKQTAVALVSGNPVSQGVAYATNRVIKTTRSGIVFAGKFTIYTLQGSLTGTTNFTITPNSSGGATSTGSGKLTSGTGRYRGAHGKFTLNGGQSATAPAFVLHTTGTVSY